MDPGTIIDLATMVITACNDYRTMKGDIKRIVSEVDSFRTVLRQFQEITAGRLEGVARSTYDDLIKEDGVLAQCLSELTKLRTELKPTKHLKSAMLVVTWPLKKNNIADVLDSLEKKKTALIVALQSIQISLAQDMKDEERRKNIYKWLTAPDPATNYDAALRKRSAETGTWLVNRKEYKVWKDSPNSFLWVHGMAGCGKSVLCSTVIEDLLKSTQSLQVAVAYYFFAFNDVSKQGSDNLLKSLVIQLLNDTPAVPDALLALYKKCSDGHQRPIMNDLLETLYKMLDGYQHAYIVLDALDECTEQGQLLDLLGNIAKWKLSALHIFVTSRRERCLEEGLKPLISAEIDIQSSIVYMDIQKFIEQKLQNDFKYKKWGHEQKKNIIKVLSDGANGMFQWAVCQLDALGNCYSVHELEIALKTLPKTLDETYGRILQKIPVDHQKNALCILQWVAFSTRPMDIREIAEALAIDFDNGDPHYDAKRKWQNPNDILHICANLVTVETQKHSLKLAHYSVKEYLVADHIKTSSVAQYQLNEKYANIFISQCCLAYLFQFNTSDACSRKIKKYFPLAEYAAKKWMIHAQSDKIGTSSILQKMIMELFQPSNKAYINWLSIYINSKPGNIKEIIYPIYFASNYGLEVVLKKLLHMGADVNAQGGKYMNALQAASVNGYERIVQLLLDKGANVNAQEGFYGNALYAASAKGNERIVQLLLDKGANVNAQGGYYGNALYVASESENERIVQLLLDKGANVNAEGGKFHQNALYAASVKGNERIVQLLLDKGANVNAQGGYYGNALQAASESGNERIVQLLLDKGANVNAEGGEFQNALYAASVKGNERIVQLLLDKGANVNAQGGYNENALYVASESGNERIVQLLLDKGANVNAKGGEYGNALLAASENGYERIVQLLLDKGANVNAGGGYQDALYVASVYGNERIVQLLLDKGANINAQGGPYGNALQAASGSENERIVQLLLDKGANVNAQGGFYGNALQAASESGNERIVQLLLDKGANVNAQGGYYRNALQAASKSGNERIVQLLLDKGANVNAQGGYYRNALQAASESGNERIVQLLLDKGAMLLSSSKGIHPVEII